MSEKVLDIRLVRRLVRRPPQRDEIVGRFASVMFDVGEGTGDEVLVVIEGECVKTFVTGKEGGDGSNRQLLLPAKLNGRRRPLVALPCKFVRQTGAHDIAYRLTLAFRPG